MKIEQKLIIYNESNDQKATPMVSQRLHTFANGVYIRAEHDDVGAPRWPINCTATLPRQNFFTTLPL